MAWKSEYVNFGVLKVDGAHRVRVYHNRDNYATINTGLDTVTDARWGGDSVLVYLSNGKVRRYKDPDNYSII